MAKAATEIAKMDKGAALATMDALDGLDVGVTGLEEVDSSERRIAGLVLNFTGLVDGNQPPKNHLVNTVTEEVSKEKTLVLLTLHKSKQWTEFVQGEGTKRRCSSWDGLIGTMEDGRSRKCAGCPDAAWRRDAAGKSSRNCGDVHNIVAIDRATNDLLMIRAKKTALEPWKGYLNKYFLGKRTLSDGRKVDMPLFAFETRLTGKMEQKNGAAYAIPVFEPVADAKGNPTPLPRAEVQVYLETAKGVREMYLDRVREVAESTDAAEGGSSPDDGGDTTFEFGANVIDTVATPTSNKHF